MIGLPDLSGRNRQPEVMDQPGLDERRHRAALRGLARVNRLSRTAPALWPHVRRFAEGRHNPDPLRILDVACGGGDLAVALAVRARRGGLPVRVTGCDLSDTALTVAREAAARHRVDVTFGRFDVLHEPLPPADVITCSLFLHHLEESEAIALIRGMTAAGLVLVDDLSRSASGYAAAWLGTRLLSRCDVVHTDGPISVRAAFTPDEAASLADRAGLRGATVTPRWPWRWLLRWENPDAIR